MNPETIVMYPAPGIGHMISMVELGKLILRHHSTDLSVTILLTAGCMDSPSVDSYIASISRSHPAISFVRFPALAEDPEMVRRHSRPAVVFDFINRNAPNFRRSLLEIAAGGGRVRAAVIDMFCGSALPVARELGVPVYYFYTSGASDLAAFLFFPTILEKLDKSLKDQQGVLLNLPGGLPPLKATEMPEPTLDKDDPAFSNMHEFCFFLAKSDGILVNTFEELEPTGLRALTSGVCVPGGPTPPIFCIGPLVSGPESWATHSIGVQDDLAWLDRQPSNRVLFLCFGSRGTFTAAQVKEIAIGLEQSGQLFFWVLKRPASNEISKQVHTNLFEFNLESVLPDGFLERTRDRGRVVKSWAPQVEVLSKESVGGFMTHCGWNSVLEAVVAGVPMIAWPLYAEQHLNRNILVENMRMAIAVEEGGDGIVGWKGVERAVTELMAGEGGKELREKSLRMKEKAKEALQEGGSSLNNLAKLVDIWKAS
ncbi:hypothetical protein CRG98_022157 [Punica granatum]|uniref:Glycosyltransferase n=2 Tax=Punica granatum TaxID=22663 RepID=A0A2I0JPU3_PUNGR|nr:hypothetical protein CRG98_022157 [Punica granatum]